MESVRWSRCGLSPVHLYQNQLPLQHFNPRGWNDYVFFVCLFVFFGCIGSSLLRRLSLVAVSGGYSLLQCTGFSLQWLLLLQSTGSRRVGFSRCDAWASVVVAHGLWSAGSVIVVHGLSCSAACGIFPDQDLNPCPLHWEADY